jgi:hypothetical protein
MSCSPSSFVAATPSTSHPAHITAARIIKIDTIRPKTQYRFQVK